MEFHIENQSRVNNDIYDALGERWYTAFDDPVALLRLESEVKAPWILERIRNSFPGESLPKVLDVGCGAGFLSNRLAREGYTVTGIDVSEGSLRVAKKHDVTGSVDYQKADAYDLPFSDASLDVVTAMDFLEHVDRPEAVIREISRVLKPSGLFFFHTFNRNRLAHFVIIKMVEWLVRNTPKNMHVIELFITPAELTEFCAINEMEVQEMTGLRPRFSTLNLKSILSRTVPKSFAFQLSPSLKLSYLGYARKNRTPVA